MLGWDPDAQKYVEIAVNPDGSLKGGVGGSGGAAEPVAMRSHLLEVTSDADVHLDNAVPYWNDNRSIVHSVQFQPRGGAVWQARIEAGPDADTLDQGMEGRVLWPDLGYYRLTGPEARQVAFRAETDDVLLTLRVFYSAQPYTGD